jgi:hypothetical protein
VFFAGEYNVGGDGRAGGIAASPSMSDRGLQRAPRLATPAIPLPAAKLRPDFSAAERPIDPCSVAGGRNCTR